MPKPKIAGGNMTVNKARKIWREVYDSARDGDPERMLTAVSRFEGIANTMFLKWEEDA